MVADESNVNWAQCDNCDKWRIVKEVGDGFFECSMVGGNVTCETPEDNDDEDPASSIKEKSQLQQEEVRDISVQSKSGVVPARTAARSGRYKQIQTYIDDTMDELDFESEGEEDLPAVSNDVSKSLLKQGHNGKGKSLMCINWEKHVQSGIDSDDDTFPDSPNPYDRSNHDSPFVDEQEIAPDSPFPVVFDSPKEQKDRCMLSGLIPAGSSEEFREFMDAVNIKHVVPPAPAC
jgi:hypothetical protein